MSAHAFDEHLAVAALGLDFAGVDLLPVDDTVGYTVLEVNGAVEFDDVYSQPGHDVYRDLAIALGVAEPVAAPAPAARESRG